jgi:hypothetical protein
MQKFNASDKMLCSHFSITAVKYLRNIYAKCNFSIDSLPRLQNFIERSFSDVNIVKIC